MMGGADGLVLPNLTIEDRPTPGSPEYLDSEASKLSDYIVKGLNRNPTSNEHLNANLDLTESVRNMINLEGIAGRNPQWLVDRLNQNLANHNLRIEYDREAQSKGLYHSSIVLVDAVRSVNALGGQQPYRYGSSSGVER